LRLRRVATLGYLALARRGDLPELFKTFPGDPLEVGAVLGRENARNRIAVTIQILMLGVQATDVGDRVDRQAFWTAVE
jgi:hypothetical protein